MKKIDLEKRIKELEQKLSLSERRADFLHKEIVDLAQGVGVKATWHTNKSPWSYAMSNKAAMALKKVWEIK